MSPIVPSCFAAELKAFLQSHLLGEIILWARSNKPTVPDSLRRDHDVVSTFSMGFHLSYVALREGPLHSDPRGVRQSYSMIKPMDETPNDLFYYDAHTS